MPEIEEQYVELWYPDYYSGRLVHEVHHRGQDYFMVQEYDNGELVETYFHGLIDWLESQEN